MSRILLVSGILFSLIAGCSLSENKAKTIINKKLSHKKNIVLLKVQGDRTRKVLRYLTKNNYIDNVPTRTSLAGAKQYKITPDNGILYNADNDYLTITKDPKTGEPVILLQLQIHERVKKINKMVNDPSGKKVVINYTGQYHIIKSNDRIWSWCKATETCSIPLSNLLNDEYKVQMTLIKGDHGWE